MTRQYYQFRARISAGWLNETTGYGLTWWISQRKGDTYFAHSGSVSGYTAFIMGNLNKKTGFVILTNGNRAHKHIFDLALKTMDLMEDSIK
jgi:CubicO group peptidase (beta-lactamase class C family)